MNNILLFSIIAGISVIIIIVVSIIVSKHKNSGISPPICNNPCGTACCDKNDKCVDGSCCPNYAIDKNGKCCKTYSLCEGVCYDPSSQECINNGLCDEKSVCHYNSGKCCMESGESCDKTYGCVINCGDGFTRCNDGNCCDNNIASCDNNGVCCANDLIVGGICQAQSCPDGSTTYIDEHGNNVCIKGFDLIPNYTGRRSGYPCLYVKADEDFKGVLQFKFDTNQGDITAKDTLLRCQKASEGNVCPAVNICGNSINQTLDKDFASCVIPEGEFCDPTLPNKCEFGSYCDAPINGVYGVNNFCDIPQILQPKCRPYSDGAFYSESDYEFSKGDLGTKPSDACKNQNMTLQCYYPTNISPIGLEPSALSPVYKSIYNPELNRISGDFPPIYSQVSPPYPHPVINPDFIFNDVLSGCKCDNPISAIPILVYNNGTKLVYSVLKSDYGSNIFMFFAITEKQGDYTRPLYIDIKDDNTFAISDSNNGKTLIYVIPYTDEMKKKYNNVVYLWNTSDITGLTNMTLDPPMSAFIDSPFLVEKIFKQK